MDNTTKPTRAAAFANAGRSFAQALYLLDTLPVEEAARGAYTPTGPSIEELERRIRARREQAALAERTAS